jgi:hypothetical protein
MGFSPEDRLLFHCSRVNLSEEALAAASVLLQQDLNWDYILETSILHGVAPLFYGGLRQLSGIMDVASAVPSKSLEELERLYHHNLARNRRLYGVVGEVFRAFARNGVQAMGLKDLPLARTVFPDMGLRPIGDIDILIHQEDYAQVEKCLGDLGFVPLPEPDCPYLLKYAWALHFHRAADDVWIDVQWGVLQLEWDAYAEGNFDFEIERMWRGARILAIDDYEILEPKPEDMLFHLCMHLEGHHYAELILLCDIAELLQTYGDTLDWEYLITLAKKYRVEASLYYALLITQRLFDCTLPGSFGELESERMYFNANLLGPLFGNLTTLHVALDDVYRLASPPAEVMARFEAIVRRQTAYAMRLYEELDRLATTSRDLGAAVAIFGGGSSQMVFPSQALPPFPDIYLYTLEQDRSRLSQALLASGFVKDQGSDAEAYGKHREFESRDPAVSAGPLSLEIQVQVVDELKTLLQPGAERTGSKKHLALQVLAGALRLEEDEPIIRLQLYLVVLEPEEMVSYLAARSSQRQHERLFGLCSFLEFFRCYDGPVAWQRVAETARRHGLEHQVHEGLLMANALLSYPLPTGALSQFDSSGPSSHLLRWARYGPAEMQRYTSFKELFFRVFAFLSIRGMGAKLRYLSSPSNDGRTGGMFLRGVDQAARLGAEQLASSFRRPTSYTATDFAYWTKPEPMGDAAGESVDGTGRL